MTSFESKYFRKFAFTNEQVDRYLANALRDLRIAHESKHNEVIFNYSFTALIKAGIALLAGRNGVKVRSVPGHHIKIIEKMSELLADETIAAIGNAMRMKRNEDFYGGGIFVSDKESGEYLNYVEQILDKVRKNLAR